MPAFRILQNWIIEKTGQSRDYGNESIETGTLDFALALHRNENGIADPLQITVQSTGRKTLIAGFSIPVTTPDLFSPAAIKKIDLSPFYVASSSRGSSIIDIIDFYNWREHTELYRIFLVQHTGSDFELRLSFAGEESVQPLTDSLFTTGDFFWQGCAEKPLHYQGNEVILKNLIDKGSQGIWVLRITNRREPPDPVTVERAYDLLKSLVDESRREHIGNRLIVADNEFQQTLENIWSRQKVLTPDWHPASAVLSDPARYQVILTWIIEVGIYFDHRSMLDEIRRALQANYDSLKSQARMLFLLYRLERYLNIPAENRILSDERINSLAKNSLTDTADPFYACLLYTEHPVEWTDNQRIYLSYFRSGRLASDFLQNYWNRLSLPLFENVLQRELTNNPEKMLLLLLGGLYHRLPFAKILSDLISRTEQEPILALFRVMQQQIQKRYFAGINCSYKPGSDERFPGKRLILFDGCSIRYTRRGRTTFLQLCSADHRQVRIDKRCQCVTDLGHNRISIFPDVPFYCPEEEKDRYIEIESPQVSVRWPLVWPAGEILLTGLRLRWLFKKRRYQLTIQKTKDYRPLTVDNQPLEAENRQKVLRYVDVPANPPRISLQLLDTCGRTIQFRQRASTRPVLIHGWVKNHHGQFETYVNYHYGKRQHTIRANDSDVFSTPLRLPAEIRELILAIRRLQQPVALNHFVDFFIEKLLRHSHRQGRGYLMVVIDPLSENGFAGIRDFFDAVFAFQPKFLFERSTILPVVSTTLIYISGRHDDNMLVNDGKISASAYLRIGVRRGIDQLQTLNEYLIRQINATVIGRVKR